jgi:hypothetical protein
MSTKTVSPKQQELITLNASVIEALGISDADKDAWRASGVLGRVLNPKAEVLGALKELGARPFYARSSREAEMQLTVLRALVAYERNKDPKAMYDTLAKYFKKLEVAVEAATV